MTTNVLNLPGGYLVQANSGTITLRSTNTFVNTDFNTVGNTKLGLGPRVETTGTGLVAQVSIQLANTAGIYQGMFVVGSDGLGGVSPRVVSVGEGTVIVDTPHDDTFLESPLSFLTVVEANSQFNSDIIPYLPDTFDLGTATNTWRNLNAEQLTVWGLDATRKTVFYNTTNVTNNLLRDYDPNDIYGTTEQRRAGGTFFAGGVGIEKDLNVGGFIYGRIETANTSFTLQITSTNVDITVYPTFAPSTSGQQLIFVDSTGEEGGLTYNPFRGRLTTDRLVVASTDDTTSTTTASMTVKGGADIYQTLKVENVVPRDDDQGQLGNSTTNWAEAYVQDLYTKIIASTTGSIDIKPKNELLNVYGDINVRGTNPIGTAPVVTNILYVTMDGNDTNDGRAMDSSRACRTIGGALASPYYSEGTQIRVAPGHYLEDNPLQLKPYTSIMGSDIRTTSVEPINKTQDLFHLNSGCYLAFMQFLNGRSGLLEGNYDPGFNRGAYCTAFPPLEGDARIDLFHSPYVQNCTNLSGPWLKDGTLFTPNQTVQVPSAVGTGSWSANTTTIVVKVSTGTITQGMAINPGQQNPGFFNARTLMLANKPFLQDQVVEYVDQTFNSGSFVYNTTACNRDVGLIVDSISLDMLYNTDSESVFAGLQYWRQGGYIPEIGNQISTVTDYITYVRGLAITTATNAASGTEGAIVSDRFDDIIDVVSTSTATLSTGVFSEWVTNSIVSNGVASSDANIVSATNALLAAKTSIANQTISWLATNRPDFVYTTATLVSKIENLVESVAFDLSHPNVSTNSNKQSFKTAVYYFDYTTTTEIPNEVAQTVAAYNFIKSIVGQIIKAELIVNPYGAVSQDVSGAAGTDYEVEIIRNRIDHITDIIRNGPSIVSTYTEMPFDESQIVAIQNAYGQLFANRSFIQSEVIAYIDSQFNTFDYSREKCRRDVGILVENVAYDAAFGGNEKSVESGLAYYDGVISRITGQETQTISAIDYLNELCQNVITNTTCTDLLLGAGSPQVINFVLTDGDIASDSINACFDIITDIIGNGPTAAPEIYRSTGPDAAFVSAEILMQTNRQFIQEDTINYINNLVQTFPYSERKCRRDTGLIVDSIAFDLLYPTPEQSQSTFAGLQYWSQDDYVGDIALQVNPTVEAIKYLKDLSRKIIQNITPADDLIDRYQNTEPQVTNLEAATLVEADAISVNFDNIISIVRGNKTGWTDRIIPNGDRSNIKSVENAVNLLQANKTYLGEEVVAFVDATNQGFTYDSAKCKRDVGYMVDAISFDLLHGGNRQAIQNGLYYYGFSTSTITIQNQEVQTTAAFNTLSWLVSQVVQNIQIIPRQTEVVQDLSLPAATGAEAALLAASISTITNIITNGPNVAALPTAIASTASTLSNIVNAFEIVYANKEFLVEEVIAFIDQTYNPTSFNYNEEKCYRDVGLIVDAVSQDILLGGNYKSIEAGLAYWSSGYNSIAGQETTTTVAINHAKDIALQIIANQAVTPQSSTKTQQIINPFFQYGGDYMPQEAVRRNFGIITRIIENGPLYAPPRFMGGGLFALTGINGADVKLAPLVTSVTTVSTGTFLLGLNTATIGSGTNATLYIGETAVFPKTDSEVEEFSLEYTGNSSTWNQRKVDPIGSMGGSLVDGAVISNRSPIQSFVYDAFTQLTQGGRGIHITNNGYAQLVSVFTIFCSVGVQTDNGGIASIVNSNANFGDICLLSKGYGPRKFSGTLYNPAFIAYNSDTNQRDEELDQFYPNGFWPNNAKVLVFLPDLDDRPHISLVMEIVPPVDYENEQSTAIHPMFGFLNAAPTTGTITTGSLTISGISTEGIAVGNSVYIRDKFGRSTGTDGLLYADTGTVVTDISYNTVTLNKALTSGGSDSEFPSNTAYFDVYFAGNSYYTVLSSQIAENPKPEGVNILSTASTGLPTSQVPAHIDALTYLNTITNLVIANNTFTALQATSTQIVNQLISGGAAASEFIDLRFTEMKNIISTATVQQAEAVIPPRLRTKSGPAVEGAGSAIRLIELNLDFLADEINAYVQINYPSLTFNADKCKRDTKIILQRLIYDIQTGGRYNSVMVGLSYWSRTGTHHVVQIGENITRTDLVPDGATVNFYQRSYMSASGYVFEYVGAGTNYGSLPQVGRADPVQGKEVVMLDGGKVFYTSTDQNGDFRIGPGLVISQATGVLSGRTFTRSLFANLTPFILAIEGGG